MRVAGEVRKVGEAVGLGWAGLRIADAQRGLEEIGDRVEDEDGSAPTDDLDALARKLYPMIRPYLKRELWLDRERAGMLTDLL